MDNSVVRSGMTAETWAKLKELFDQALSLEGPDRSGFVAAAYERDHILGNELRELVHQHDMASFSSQPFISRARLFEYFQAGLRTFTPGDVVCGRFLIEQFLGEGGMGEVYRAYDQDLSEVIALKTLRPHISTDDQMVSFFKREIHLARRVTHPNVCRIFDMFWHTNNGQALAVLTMEYLEGQTLLDYIRSRGPIEPTIALPIIQQVAAGLDAAHELGIIHRDFKNSNIMLVSQPNTDARAVVMDFGLACEYDKSRQTSTGEQQMLGTPAYIAPEQMKNLPLTTATDIYAFGVVLFELLTGCLPFSGGINTVLHDKVHRPQPSFSQAKVRNPAWEKAILKCLEHDPLNRPVSAGEVFELLQKPSPKISRRWFLVTGAVIVAGSAIPFLRFRGQQPTVAHTTALASFKRAQEFSKRRTKEGLENALFEYDHAARLQPDNAEIWIGLADAYSAMANFQFLDPNQALPAAREAARRAIQINPVSGRAKGVLAYCMSIDIHEWLRAEPYFQEAIRDAAEDPEVRLWYSAHLTRLGRNDDALVQLKIGLEQEPMSLVLNEQLAAVYFLMNQNDKFEAQARELIRLQPLEATAHLILARAQEESGHYREALESCDKAEQYHHSKGALCIRGSIEASQGQYEKARKIALQIEQYWMTNAFESLLLAALYSKLHNDLKALDILFIGCDRNDSSVLLTPQHPHLQTIHKQQKYNEFLKRIGLHS